MKSVALVMVLGLLLSANGCSRSPESEAEKRKARSDYGKFQKPEQAPSNLREYYDAKGNLAPSNEKIEGLTLPKGLFFFRKTGRTHIFRTAVPLQKITAYFGPRLFTGDIVATERSATWRQAIVKTSDFKDPTRLTVSVISIGNNLARVSIETLGASDDDPPPADAIRAQMRKEANRLY